MSRYRRITKGFRFGGRAGCYTCHGAAARWLGQNAQGVAARHTDATGHRTWYEGVQFVSYEALGVEYDTDQRMVRSKQP